jgi:hypothetical protein
LDVESWLPISDHVSVGMVNRASRGSRLSTLPGDVWLLFADNKPLPGESSPGYWQV